MLKKITWKKTYRIKPPTLAYADMQALKLAFLPRLILFPSVYNVCYAIHQQS